MFLVNGISSAVKYSAKAAHVVGRGVYEIATADKDEMLGYTQIFARGAAKALVAAEVDKRTLAELSEAGVLEEFDQTAQMLADFVVPIVDELARTQAGNWAGGNGVAIRQQLYVIFLEVLNNLRKNVIDGKLGMANATGVFKTVSDVISRDAEGKLSAEQWAALGTSMEELLVGDLLKESDGRVDGDLKRLLRPILIPGADPHTKPESTVLAMVLTSSAKAAVNEDLFVSMLGSMLQPYANKSLDQLLFGDKSFGELEARRELVKALTSQSKKMKKLSGAQKKAFVNQAMQYADRWLASQDAKPLLQRWSQQNHLDEEDRPAFEEQIHKFSMLSRFELIFESKLSGSTEDRARMMELLRPWFGQAEVNEIALRLGSGAATAADRQVLNERLKEAKAMLSLDPVVAKHVHENLGVVAKLADGENVAELEASVMERMRSWLASDEGRSFAMAFQKVGELSIEQRAHLQGLLQGFAAGETLQDEILQQMDAYAANANGLNIADEGQRQKLVQHAKGRMLAWLTSRDGQKLVLDWNSKAPEQIGMAPLRAAIQRELQTAQVELALQGRLETFLKAALDKFLPEQVKQMQAQELQRSARKNILVGLATRLNKDVDQLLRDFDDGTLSAMLARRLAPQLVQGMREQLPSMFGARSFEDLKGSHIAKFAINQLRGALDVNFAARQQARALFNDLTEMKQRARDDYQDDWDQGRFEDARQATRRLIDSHLQPNHKVEGAAINDFKRNLLGIDTEGYMEEGALDAKVNALIATIEKNEVPESRVNREDVLAAARKRVGELIQEVNITDLNHRVKRTLVSHLERVRDEDLSPTRQEGEQLQRQATNLKRLDQAIGAMRLYGLKPQIEPIREELQAMRQLLVPVLLQDERRSDLQASLQAVLGKLGPVTAATNEKQLVSNLVSGILQFVGWWLGNLFQTFFLDLRERFGVDVAEQRRRMSEKHFEFKVQDSDLRVQSLARDLIDKPTEELKEERLHHALHYLLVARA